MIINASSSWSLHHHHLHHYNITSASSSVHHHQCIIISASSSVHHHHFIIICSSSSSVHHHQRIIISASSSKKLRTFCPPISPFPTPCPPPRRSSPCPPTLQFCKWEKERKVMKFPESFFLLIEKKLKRVETIWGKVGRYYEYRLILWKVENLFWKRWVKLKKLR